MQPLQLDEKTAKELYPNAEPALRAVLNASFGEQFFKAKKPWNEILTLDDIFEATGADPKDPKYSTGTPDEIGYHFLKLLPKALNPAGWVADFNNSNQRKWSPWFYMNSPGFRFYVSYDGYSATGSASGSRLCYAEEPISDHAGKQFLWLYKQWLA